MRFVVAVSGGVDSVVLLDMLVNGQFGVEKSDLVVAHFDHGIRKESADDADFVRELADKYELPFETKREDLGQDASEELARTRRYAFLRSVAKKYEATIITAHHADDVVETIAINLLRGTGWRGLAVLDSPDIWRPLVMMRKQDIISYAGEHHLTWRDDATNSDTKYLRNDIRQKLAGIDEATVQLLGLYRNRQIFLKNEIDTESSRLAGSAPYSRHLVTMAPHDEAVEILRAILTNEPGSSHTRPQLDRALHAVKVFDGGKKYEVGAGINLVFTKTEYVVEDTSKVLS